MSMQVRCPLCGMQVDLNKLYFRPVVAVYVGSKGRGRIFHNVIHPVPTFVLERVKDVLESAFKRVGGGLAVREMESVFDYVLKGYSPSVKETNILNVFEAEEVI